MKPEELKELRERAMDHAVVADRALVIVSARELGDLLDIAEGKAPPVYAPARGRVILTPGHAVQIAREAQRMTQERLAVASGVSQESISRIERGCSRLGAKRAEKLARALRVHPSVLLYPNGDELEGAVDARARTSAKALADNLRSARLHAGLSLDALAAKLNVSWQIVDRRERGRARPSLAYVRKVLKACKLPEDWKP